MGSAPRPGGQKRTRPPARSRRRGGVVFVRPLPGSANVAGASWRTSHASLEEGRARPARGPPDGGHRARDDPGAPSPRAAPKKAAPAAAPAAPVKVTSVEGITEYRLSQRPARAALPRSDQADDHRQHHLPGRLAQRELRRDRNGAPARAPGLQGNAEPHQHPAGADGARRAAERLDLVRPHELLRDVPARPTRT